MTLGSGSINDIMSLEDFLRLNISKSDAVRSDLPTNRSAKISSRTRKTPPHDRARLASVDGSSHGGRLLQRAIS